MTQNNNPWVSFVTNFLLSISPDSTEQIYYGPYNTILGQAFPPASRYIIAPQSYFNGQQAVNFLEYVVMVDSKVVMIVDIKRENILQYEHARVEADLRVCDKFHSIHESIILSEIIYISIFGRFCRVYRYIPITKQITSDSGEGLHPDRWNIDLYTEQGRDQLGDIFGQMRIRVEQELGPV